MTKQKPAAPKTPTKTGRRLLSMTGTTLQMDIDTVQPHPRNVRQGDIGAISQSLEAHGQYRPIVFQRSTGNIIAGNHTWKAAKALGWTKIDAIAFECNDEKALRILLVDNRSSDLATYDDAGLVELLKELADTDDGLLGTLWDGDDLDQLISYEQYLGQEPPENIYTAAINVPQYEMTGEKPHINELCDTSRTVSLLEQIGKHDLPPELARFLELAASRHTVFNYSKIAEYFAHSTLEVQELMRESVLIIIDYKDAMRLGYLAFEDTINELEAADNDGS